MEMRHFKEPLWLHFWWQTFFSIILIVEKCVHFDIWNKKNSENFKGSPLWFGSLYKIWIWLKISKMSQIIGGTLWNFWIFLFQISQCTQFSTIRMMEKNVCRQKWSHSSSLKSILDTLYTDKWRYLILRREKFTNAISKEEFPSITNSGSSHLCDPCTNVVLNIY